MLLMGERDGVVFWDIVTIFLFGGERFWGASGKNGVTLCVAWIRIFGIWDLEKLELELSSMSGFFFWDLGALLLI